MAKKPPISMKANRILATGLAVFISFCAYAQAHHVDYQINEKGEYYRADSEKTYYVIEYDEVGDAQSLSDLFYNSWERLVNKPSYFDIWLRNSSYDITNGIISGTTKGKYFRGVSASDIEFKYAYQLQFRDGRVRIDPPEIMVHVDGVWSYPNEFLKSKLLLESKEKAFKARKEILDSVGNNLINELLSFIDEPNDSWPSPVNNLGSSFDYFSLGNNFKFEFPDQQESATFLIEGLKKDSFGALMEKTVNNIDDLIKYQNFYNNVTVKTYEDGVLLSGFQDFIILGTLFYPTDCTFWYEIYIACEDNMVRVYVPKITKARTSLSSGSTDYRDLGSFLRIESICGNDGTHKRPKEIEKIELQFNMLAFAPLVLINSALNQPSPEEEEW